MEELISVILVLFNSILSTLLLENSLNWLQNKMRHKYLKKYN